ncbi:MAG: hypothetical protein ABIQ98_05340 [Sphingomicrobium sp.]
MIRRTRLFAAAAVVALALPALAQERPTSILPPGFGDPATPPPPPAVTPRSAPGRPPSVAPAPDPGAPSSPSLATPDAATADPALLSGGEDQVATSNSLDQADEIAAVTKPQEVPDSARRDPALVGRLDPAAIGLGADPWGSSRGSFLETAMRRTEGAIPSRWLHIALRNALLARAPTPFGVDPADWVAERAWLLLRMGEADAARMLIAGVDVADFTPKLTQVAVQSALASADPAGLCPLRAGLGDVEPRIAPLVDAMCSSMGGNPEAAAADIDNSRRRGRLGGIDVSLADKLVGAGADSARAVTIEWEPVDRLNVWRFGLASASGLAPPDRLLSAASVAMRAWQARAPMLSIEQRLPSARIATGLGVFSGQSLVDAYATLYDRTDPDDLPQSDAWQVRLAFTGQDQDARLAAMRKLFDKAKDPLEREATRALLALAASRITPSADLAADAPDLISAMLAGGLDDAAAAWAPVLDKMDDAQADRCWAMLALAAPTTRGLDLSFNRIDKFVDRDASEDHRRGALLVAGLAGLGRIDAATALRLSGRYGFGFNRRDEWGDLIKGAARRGQGGTATLLAGLAFKSPQWRGIPALFLLHSVSALTDTGQGFNARMIAAEALSRS